MKNVFLILAVVFSLYSCDKDEMNEDLVVQEEIEVIEQEEEVVDQEFNLIGKYSNDSQENNYVLFFYEETLDLQYAFKSGGDMVVDHLARDIKIKDIIDGYIFRNNKYTLTIENGIVKLKHETSGETRVVILNEN